MKRFGLIGVVSCVALLAGCGDEEVKKPEVARPAKILTIEKGYMMGTRSFPGKVAPSEDAKLSFRISGPLVKLPVDSGTEVKKGQLIAQIDPRDFETAVAATNASIEELNARLKDANLTFERYKSLIAKNAVSQAQFDTSKNTVAALKANLKSLEAQKKKNLDTLADTKLLAPFDGIIAEKYVNNFEDVQAKQPIIYLQDISSVDIEIEVPEELMIYKDEQQAKHAIIHGVFPSIGDKKFFLKLKSYNVEADADTNTYKVTLTMPAPDKYSLKSGMTCTVIHTSERYGTQSGVRIPADSVMNDEAGKPFVWVVSDESRLVKRPVTTGQITSSGIAVKSGVKVGDKILAAGVHYAYENMLVKPRSAK